MPYISRFETLTAAIDEELLTSEEVAELLTVPVETLARWRKQNTGPSWYQFVDEVRYSTIELENFLRDSMHDTSKHTMQQIPPWIVADEKQHPNYQTKLRKSL